MKEAIHFACNCVDDDEEPIENPLLDFEIDNIAFDDDFDKAEKLKLSEAKTMKLPLGILKAISKEVSYLTPIYDEIIRKAILPSPTPKDYCVMLKFEEE